MSVQNVYRTCYILRSHGFASSLGHIEVDNGSTHSKLDPCLILRIFSNCFLKYNDGEEKPIFIISTCLVFLIGFSSLLISEERLNYHFCWRPNGMLIKKLNKQNELIFGLENFLCKANCSEMQLHVSGSKQGKKKKDTNLSNV